MSAGGQGERLELGLDPLSILLQGDGAGEGSSSKPLFDEEVTGEQEGEEEEAEEAEGTIAEEPSEEEIEIYLTSPPPAADEPAKLPPMPGPSKASSTSPPAATATGPPHPASASGAGSSSGGMSSVSAAFWALPQKYTQKQQPQPAPSPAPTGSTAPLPPPPEPEPVESVAVEDLKLLSGEHIGANIMGVSLMTVHGVALPGQLVITSYQVIFLPYPGKRPAVIAHLGTQYFRVPLSGIDRLEREAKRGQARGDASSFSTLLLAAKDGRVLRLILPDHANEASAEQIFNLIQAYAFPRDLFKYLFCFAHHKALLSKGHVDLVSPGAGWDLYDPEAELDRQGVLRPRPSGAASPWRVTLVNTGYEVCSHYPTLLVVPRDVSDDELLASAAFRSEGRLPVLTWGRHDSSGSLWRSSQPKVGVAGASCPEDEKLLRLIGLGDLTHLPLDANPSARPGPGVLHILDCRHRAAAMANRATGHGYESATNYPSANLCFYNIGNIHAMRDSLSRLLAVVHSPTLQDVEWSAHLEGTKWLTHTRLVLNAAFCAAHFVHRDHASVLVHCSHGWDRTAQVVSLSQLMLDPYFRTMDGFFVLIEKDWLAFGHPFQLRSAHGQDRNTRTEDQLAPIFLQWLDCVWQLLHQHPSLFEFNARLLLAIADHLYDGRFGNFLCDSEKQRRQHALHETSVSLWQYLKLNRRSFLNPLYLKCGPASHPTHILDSPLPLLLRRVTLWSDYFLRWSARPSVPLEWYSRLWRRETDPIPDVDQFLPLHVYDKEGTYALYLSALQDAEKAQVPEDEEDEEEEEGDGDGGVEEFETVEAARDEIRKLRALLKQRRGRRRANGKAEPPEGSAALLPSASPPPPPPARSLDGGWYTGDGPVLSPDGAVALEEEEEQGEGEEQG